MEIKWRKRSKFFVLTALLFLCFLYFPFLSSVVPADYSVVVRDRDGAVLRAFLNEEEQWCFPPNDTAKVPYKLEKAVLHYEDKYFRWHPGINPYAIARAIKLNWQSEKIESGASTITMQVARLGRGSRRSYWNKFVEVFRSFRIEAQYSKDEILSMYLDHAPFGGNIIGYRAASQKYFLKEPEQLSWAEAATFAVLPNAPGLISPDKNPSALLRKRNDLLEELYEGGLMDTTTYNLALSEPLPSGSFPFEQHAHHLTERLGDYDEKELRTTLDLEIQYECEDLVRNYSYEMNIRGVENASVIVLDTKTGAVLAYVGSQDYYDFEKNGMVDGVIAPRSSGSLLKPFLYALSIDEGLIHPNTVIKDIPTYYGAYSPKNASKDYDGLVPAKEALIRSLNIPAVRLLNSYGVYSFYEFLNDAGLTTLFRSAEEYGLPLIIGGAEVNLLEMAMLYQGLANNGRFTYPYFLQTDQSNSSKQLISDGACYQVLEMIKKLQRPGLESYWEEFAGARSLAWKTGTSYGHKDAWAVGVNPEYTIAVWLGNFDGTGNNSLVGTTAAGPLLFQVLERISGENRSWFKKHDEDFRSLRLCKSSGFLASEHCFAIDTLDFPINARALKLCPYHVSVEVDSAGKEMVCSHCWKKGHYSKSFLKYPSDVVLQLSKKGRVQEVVPHHNQSCSVGEDLSSIEFVYPVDSALIWIPRDFDGKFQRIIAEVAIERKEERVFWYCDNRYLGVTKKNHNLALDLKPGKHRLIARSEGGTESTSTFYVLKKK